ncbi:sn-glycerol 3-phosphate transport system ATP-binding protein [Legionella beliardensis]|uniref:sn-glycerol 3-phosphate transport system ATP-binding protein n=1 Tax=Legionella beliardensis TaxID=91822 RepID=A0A378I3K9_9GAMM|nr:sn-glycerol-3-phosphate ABC transporter ATP-binding protein UgpC [Legionella beliardensis]STX29276.1 sn-glycerol 3-phosphate transport system ATP-binding protein [Legionella beliardensis]
MATVNLIDVCKQYGQQTILNHINLTIERGEFIAVIGPSGCGKSTLLRLVAGLDEVSSGRILINNECVNETPAHRRDMAMVFQSYALYPHMTVYDNMAYGLKLRGMKKEAIKQRVTDVAALLHLSDYLQRKPQALSGGQRQRVAMGRAIVRSPAVFLFDEPLSNLDTKLRAQMRHEIKKLHQELNTTCLYVTHDQVEAMTMAARILVLNNGKVEQFGSPQLLYQKPASIFVAEYIGLYPVNFLPGKLNTHQKKIQTNFGFDFPWPDEHQPMMDNESVLIGIRPEHLHITDESDDTIEVRVSFIDNMGADKLIHAYSLHDNHRFTIKTSAETIINKEIIKVKPVVNKANLFQQQTGLRIGGWHD